MSSCLQWSWQPVEPTVLPYSDLASCTAKHAALCNLTTRIANHRTMKNQSRSCSLKLSPTFEDAHSAIQQKNARGKKVSRPDFFSPNMMQMVWNVNEACWAHLAAKGETHWPQNRTQLDTFFIICFIFSLQDICSTTVLQCNENEQLIQYRWASPAVCSILTEMSNKVRCVIWLGLKLQALDVSPSSHCHFELVLYFRTTLKAYCWARNRKPMNIRCSLQLLESYQDHRTSNHLKIPLLQFTHTSL